MSRRRKARTVEEIGILHPQLVGTLVHPLHKGGLTAGQVFGQSHGGIVARHHGDCLEHVVHRHLLPLFEVDL